MKLSQFTADEGCDVLVALMPYITSIASDDELLDAIKKKVDLPEDATRSDMIQVGVDKVNTIAMYLLKKKRQDIFGIIAVLNRKTVEEIAEQNFIKTMRDVLEIAKDKDLVDFFKSCTDVIAEP